MRIRNNFLISQSEKLASSIQQNIIYSLKRNCIMEQMKSDKEVARLLEFLRNTHFDTTRQVIEALKAEVETHRNGAEPNDDLTMMCLRVDL